MTLRHATKDLKVRFSATVGEEPKVETALVYRIGASAFLTDLCARGFLRSS